MELLKLRIWEKELEFSLLRRGYWLVVVVFLRWVMRSGWGSGGNCCCWDRSFVDGNRKEIRIERVFFRFSRFVFFGIRCRLVFVGIVGIVGCIW